MAAPPSNNGRPDIQAADENSEPQRLPEGLVATQPTSNAVPQAPGDGGAASKRRRNHRGGQKKKKNRRQSFAAPSEDPEGTDNPRSNGDHLQPPATAQRPSFYRLGHSGRSNLSDTSLDSQALLDHRDQQPMRSRRESRLPQNAYGSRQGQSGHDTGTSYRTAYSNPFVPSENPRRTRAARAHKLSGDDGEEDDTVTNDRTPLLRSSNHDKPAPYASGQRRPGSRGNHLDPKLRRSSTATSASSRRKRHMPTREPSSGPQQDYDVNNPPSVPNSPRMGPDMAYEDVMLTESFKPKSPEDRRATAPMLNDLIIDMDVCEGEVHGLCSQSSPLTPRRDSTDHRRHTVAMAAEEDVCFPLEGMSEVAEDDFATQAHDRPYESGNRRRRGKQWPDLEVLDEWSREEKEQRSEGIRAKKTSEPVLVGGRLRPQKYGWHRAEEDAPYRFTYFNEEFQSTIHSQTISELVQPGQSFRDLFIPDPPELEDDLSDDEDLTSHQGTVNGRSDVSPNGGVDLSKTGTRQSSIIGEAKAHSISPSGNATPSQTNDQQQMKKPKRYGSRPTFWLDVLKPTDTEMRVISKTFGIHPLTAEDVMMQEAREKVELFRNYYFVNYRTFEQDMNSEDFLEPINMYVVVFREGVISFHFSMTPHPANVRRRIRQLKDYLILSSDWISYAIIDDITDVFAPLIENVEEEVDDIDDAILKLHSADKPDNNQNSSGNQDNEKRSEAGDAAPESGGDMLRRVGECRKKVMGLYRLLGNKADVIKGFAKRCNEHWEIAPRSEIGLYLGDIQDHILTMTSNLGHYETLLSRAHSNYLAQINIRMNERQEQTADVLGKLTVLGTIVLPMNIITGMWGMNVPVPGQNSHNIIWFWSITAGLFAFGVSCFFIAKRVYGIV